LYAEEDDGQETLPTLPTKNGGQDLWQAESDHRTLCDAAKIIADKARMKGVRAQQTRAQDALSALGSLLAKHKLTGQLASSRKGA
jgi:hypothetical protein